MHFMLRKVRKACMTIQLMRENTLQFFYIGLFKYYGIILARQLLNKYIIA